MILLLCAASTMTTKRYTTCNGIQLFVFSTRLNFKHSYFIGTNHLNTLDIRHTSPARSTDSFFFFFCLLIIIGHWWRTKKIVIGEMGKMVKVGNIESIRKAFIYIYQPQSERQTIVFHVRPSAALKWQFTVYTHLVCLLYLRGTVVSCHQNWTNNLLITS